MGLSERPDRLCMGTSPRALFAQPKLLLMDEPFGALDPITRDELQQQFVGLQRKLGTTVVFVTHDMTEALLISDRIAVMQHGKIVQVATPGELLNSPAGDFVARLMETPKRQALQLELLAQQRRSSGDNGR